MTLCGLSALGDGFRSRRLVDVACVNLAESSTSRIQRTAIIQEECIEQAVGEAHLVVTQGV